MTHRPFRAAIHFALFMFSVVTGVGLETTLTLQGGVDDYEGVSDTLLYAPSSVAKVNYGTSPTFAAGLNRWNEKYVALLHFDLGDLPPAVKIKRAALMLYDSNSEWPSMPTSFDVSAIAEANHGWVEGTNDGTRVPVPGTPCWSFHTYNSRRWAGKPGLEETGTDYISPPMTSFALAPTHEGWLTLDLPADVVQNWIRDPQTNAGVHIWPPKATTKGQIVYFRSSESDHGDPSGPKLILTVEMTSAEQATFRRNAVLTRLRKARMELNDSKSKAKVYEPLPRLERQLNQLEQRILSLEQQLATRVDASIDELETFGKLANAIRENVARTEQGLTVARAAAANRSRGLPDDFALGVCDSMQNVLRDPQAFAGSFPREARIALARNEFEAFQVVVIPLAHGVVGAVGRMSALRGPGEGLIPEADTAVGVVGYVRKKEPSRTSKVEWWPAPVLDFLESVDVAQGGVHPFWVCVRTREATPAGDYRGTFTVTTDNGASRKLPVTVEVFDFAIPREQHLPTVWGNNAATFSKVYGERFDAPMTERMMDFLIDHRLAVNTLYSAQASGKPGIVGSVGYPSLSDPAKLRRLWDRGSRWWNLGYLHPVHAAQAGLELDDYIPHFVAGVREALRVAEEAGWPKSKMAIYMFDETRNFDLLRASAEKVREAFPDIALMTTGYDRSYGVKGGPIDEVMDIWCPLTPRYGADQETITEGRKRGKKAWWYVCCAPTGKHLNFFYQNPVVQSRLLMGFAAWKYKPDGFLYYRISGWRYTKPMDTGPMIEWTPYHRPDGDGQLIMPGINGPMATIQFENLRDGLEDYEYLWVLRNELATAAANTAGDEAANGLLAVPEELLRSLTEYSEDPEVLRRHRRAIAATIVRLQHRRVDKTGRTH